MMNRYDKIIVTAPHALCPEAIERQCDLRAESAARAFYSALRSRGKPARLYISDTLRAREDLNRQPSRSTAWRQELASEIAEDIRAGRRIMIVDIHSFPGESESFGLINGVMPKIVLLDMFDTARDYYSALRAALPETKVLLGTRNDIVIQANEIGADAMLIEFNEDSEYFTDNELQRAIQAMIGSTLHSTLVLTIWIAIFIVIVLIVVFVIKVAYEETQMNAL